MTAGQPDPISYATVRLDLFCDQLELGVSGTGFVIRTRRGPILVTALHNLSGRELNGKCKHTQGGLPNRVTLTNCFGALVSNVPLYQGDNDPNGVSPDPRFFRHERTKVDVALLPLPASVGTFAANALHDSLWRPNSYTVGIPILHVADTCHIVGYPEGLTNQIQPKGVLPIWKTGHLANDPGFEFSNAQLGFDSEPLCLVDATTRPGMSGAPVFAINESGLTDEWRESAAHAKQMLDAGGRLPRLSMPRSMPFERRTRLVGIYSGRTSESSDLGLVWKPTVLHDILGKQFQSQW
jgi:hypothetical protein